MAARFPRSPFSSPMPLEARIYSELSRIADGAEGRFLVIPAKHEERRLTAAFLRWLLLEAIPALEVPLVNFEIRDVEVIGELDLSGAKSKLLLRFANCRFREKIHLSDAEVAGFALIASEASDIYADRLRTKGSVRVSAPDHYDEYPVPNENEKYPSTVSKRLRLCGAKISGNLDLHGGHFGEAGKPSDPVIFIDGAHIEGNVLLSDGFLALQEVRLNGCTIDRNLDCAGAKLENLGGYSLSAAGTHVKGTVYLGGGEKRDGGFESKGSFRLEGAKIDGDLNCAGGSFTSVAHLLEEYWPAGSDAESNEALYAIEANGVDVGGDALLSDSFTARGIVHLIAAKIGGDLRLSGGRLDFPGEESLQGDGSSVEGTTFLDEGFRTNGILRFPLASFKQGLYVDGALFDVNARCRNWTFGTTTADELHSSKQGVCGIFAPLAQVSGKLVWGQIETGDGQADRNKFWLHLGGAKADAVEDEQASWAKLDCFDVTGFDYESVLHIEPAVRWRIDELDRQYATLNPYRGREALYGPTVALDFILEGWVVSMRALGWAIRRWLPGHYPRKADFEKAVRSFTPLPYMQLASTVRAAGYEKAANDVLVRLERNRTRYSDFGLPRQLGRWALDGVIRYGFAPFRPLIFLLGMIVISAAVFWDAYDRELIMPSSDNPSLCESGTRGPCCPAEAHSTETGCEKKHLVEFNAFVFATDTLIPLVDLNQKKNWVIRTEGASPPRASRPSQGWWEALGRVWTGRPRWEVGLLYDFNIFFGWLMTSFLAAGVTGLVRGGKDGD